MRQVRTSKIKLTAVNGTIVRNMKAGEVRAFSTNGGIVNAIVSCKARYGGEFEQETVLCISHGFEARRILLVHCIEAARPHVRKAK